MSNFPNNFDDDTTLPFVNDNITEIGGEAINAVRDAVFAIEQSIGLNISGSANSLADRLGVSINPDGSIRASAITSLGLVTLPITQDQIANNAGIPESKLRLDHRTQDLFNYIRDLSNDVNQALGWISITGIKLEPHLDGAIYRHTLDQIDVSVDPINFPFLGNKFRQLRDNLQSYNLVNDINNELLSHQWADGSPFGVIQPVITNDGSNYPSNYAHVASGIFLNTSRFVNIPQTAEDMQLFAEFVDESSILLLGTRIQNLYSNGISKISRSSNLVADGYGQFIIPTTPAIAYLLKTGTNSSPYDDIDKGDDIIEFMPLAADLTSNSFDEKFALVRPGDIVRINYGTIEVPFLIREKKYIQTGGNKKFIVRIAGKNLMYAPTATARIDRPLTNSNKYGVLAAAPVNNQFLSIPSLIVGSPRGAQCLGVGFSPDEFNETHYLLYLALYPTGNPLDGYTILPGIDVTGNNGTTPGLYTLDSIVNATNASFHQAGFNYRFIAFSYQGEFGIMLADSYNNTSFSVLSAVVAPDGSLDQLGTNINFTNNVVDLFPVSPHLVAPDPLGFGPFGAGIASPPFMLSYGSAEAAIIPTVLFTPLKRNNFYVNGTEKERLNLQVGQALDQYGDGYWVATIHNITIFPGPPAGRVETTYRIPLDLSTSDLKVGKTLVVQSLTGAGTLVDFGRFIIKDITFDCSPAVFTDITVYDAVHARGASPVPTLGIGNQVAIYFNSDSVSFNAESATDFTSITPFKRHFEIYIDENAYTFTHERGRINISGSNLIVDSSITLYGSSEMAKLDIIRISPKLRGYQFGPVTKITLNINSFDNSTGLYDGYLASYDGINLTHLGPTTIGKQGEIVRFYDETNIDFIDIIFDINQTLVPFSSSQFIDFQLFPTLSLDDEKMLIGTCQLNDTTQVVNRVRDERQFGNISEKELSTSALNFIALPERLLHFNGVIRGFDIVTNNQEFITLDGGSVLVNGKILQINNQIITIPKIQELYLSTNTNINWGLCVNSIGELVLIALTDFDPTFAPSPSAPNRIITVFNAVTGNTYEVDSTSFNNLLTNRKDLTILYIISSTVTGIGSSAAVSTTSHDVRRYVNDQDSLFNCVVTDGNNQGNFKDFVTAVNWIRLNNHLQNTIEIKGVQSISVDPVLGEFGGPYISVTVIGKGGNAELDINATITNMNHVTFRDLVVNLNGPVTLGNVNFDNCLVTCGTSSVNYNTGFIHNSTISFGTSGSVILNNLSVTESSVTCTSTTGTTIENSNFSDCTLVFNGGGTLNNVDIDPSVITFAGGGLNSGAFAVANVRIFDSFVDVTIPNAFLPANESGFRFERNTVNWVATVGGSYSSTDLVNASSAMIYVNNAGNLRNIFIRDNTFSYNMSDRFSVVCFSMQTNTTYYENIDISKNKFLSGAATDDIRAVIAIVTQVINPAGSGFPNVPNLVNVFIEENMCNLNQMIVLTTTRLSGTPISSALLPACTNSRISNNTCGTIGFITQPVIVADFTNAGLTNSGLVYDKKDQLTISGNNCKFIANLDAIGQYIPFRASAFPAGSTDWVQVGTGAFNILNNSCNWIQVGVSSYTTPYSGCTIRGNRLSPANPNFLSNYQDNLVSGIIPNNVGILLRSESASTGGTRSIISNNILEQDPPENTSGTPTTYYYNAGIVCLNNAVISENSVTGVVNSSTAPILFLWSTGNMMVSDNYLDRAGLTIEAYIAGQTGATNQVSIIDNFFDSPFIDTANTNENTGLNIPINWKFERNKNQTGYGAINLNNIGLFSYENSNVWNANNGGFFGQITFDPGILNGSVDIIGDYTVESYIPQNVQILYAIIGVFQISNAGTAGTSSTFSFDFRQKLPSKFTIGSPSGSLVDVKRVVDITGDTATALSSNVLTLNSTNESTFRAATQYLTLDLSSQNYFTGPQSIILTIRVNLKSVTSQFLETPMSPAVIKYRW